MFRLLFTILIIIHSLIHLTGFLKAFQFAKFEQLILCISKTQGIFWLFDFLIFIFAAFLYFYRKEFWWLVILIAVFVSEFLIILNWQDAKFGSIVNILLLIVSLEGFFSWKFENIYNSEVNNYIRKTNLENTELLTAADLQHLPALVKKYIVYTRSLDKPKLRNFKVVFEGNFRQSETSEWMPFHSEQHNFLKSSARLFFMKATMKYLPIAGFHSFLNGIAFMDIRLFSVFIVQFQSGNEMNTAETVTFFNDMCVMAPASLIDSRITWLESEVNRVKAQFVNNDICISAWLHFNDQGELINFTSEDRYAIDDKGKMQQLPWSTPLKEYKDINGYKIASYADVIYSYPERDFNYGKFKLKEIEYNLKK